MDNFTKEVEKEMFTTWKVWREEREMFRLLEKCSSARDIVRLDVPTRITVRALIYALFNLKGPDGPCRALGFAKMCVARAIHKTPMIKVVWDTLGESRKTVTCAELSEECFNRAMELHDKYGESRSAITARYVAYAADNAAEAAAGEYRGSEMERRWQIDELTTLLDSD